MVTKLCVLGFLGLALLAATATDGAAANPVVTVETSKGTFKVELFEDKAPVTVKNFLSYVDAKHYDGTIFHRVIGKEGQLGKGADPDEARDFMIQGGGFDEQKKEKPVDKKGITNEAKTAKVSNAKYTIAMARTGDPNSATAQFYVNVGADNKFLDPSPRNPFGYCAFGKVIEGTDVVDKIKAVKVKDGVPAEAYDKDAKRHERTRLTDTPVEDVVIKSIRRVEKDKAKEKPKADGQE